MVTHWLCPIRPQVLDSCDPVTVAWVARPTTDTGSGCWAPGPESEYMEVGGSAKFLEWGRPQHPFVPPARLSWDHAPWGRQRREYPNLCRGPRVWEAS